MTINLLPTRIVTCFARARRLVLRGPLLLTHSVGFVEQPAHKRLPTTLPLSASIDSTSSPPSSESSSLRFPPWPAPPAASATQLITPALLRLPSTHFPQSQADPRNHCYHAPRRRCKIVQCVGLQCNAMKVAT